MSKWFYDTFTGAATGAARCGSFVGGALVSWSLAIDERGGHEDLHCSGHQSVIPYAYRRTGLYYSSLPCLCEPEPYLFPAYLSTLVKWHLPESFIAQGQAITMSPEAPQVASGQVKSYIVGHNG
jgi:hypothetical protein